MIPILKELNDEQRIAVQTIKGPVLILAGAGSGKTKTLTHRIAYLVEKKKIKPINILAVTFTNKAAGEMRERVARLLGYSKNNRFFMPFLGTFHGICVRILRKEAKNINLHPNFIIFDDHDSLAAIKQVMHKLMIDEKRYAPNLVSNLISSAKNELIGPIKYQNIASGLAQKTAAKIYPEYQKILHQANALDFDDLIFETCEMFIKHPKILNRWQKQLKYILIDEYQDTNHAQYQLVKKLADKHQNICVVGDDWQSIYSWRGANFQNILDFEKDYPRAKVIKLEQNYRSTKNILDAAHHVISKNKLRSDKKLWTKLPNGPGVTIEMVTNEVQEAEYIIRTIEELCIQKKMHLCDFAILYRTNAQSRSLEEAFLRISMPYKVVGGVRFYERKEIKDVLAYLRFIFSSQDWISFNRIINFPPRGIGKHSLNIFNQFCRKNKLDLHQGLQQIERVMGLKSRASTAFSQFNKIINELRIASHKLKPSALIELILRSSGLLKHLNDGSVLAADRIENVEELISLAKGYDEIGIEDLLEEVALMSDIDTYNQSTESVTLMTLHLAKGLEFPVVFIAGAEEGIMPHSSSFFDAEQMEEERRLCYVGMTRAKSNLYMICASSRLLYGKVMHNPPSRFVMDVPAELQRNYQNTNNPRPLAHEFDNLKAGDKVKHSDFGEGIVVNIEDDIVAIAFAGYGVKNLDLNYAPLQKINNQR